MKENKITDKINAQAAIAYLISEGFGIDLHTINKTIPGGLTDQDWLNIANGCRDWVMNRLAEGKVIPIARFRK